MQICRYQEPYKQQIIDLILHIQNEEAKINLSLAEQADLLDIPSYYEKDGGGFWMTIENDEVIGTLAFMNYGYGNAGFKKITKEQLPFHYEYPDRNSFLYLLNL